ncbi:MAG: YebC/PmpR family DNA-binding transcriptional regulator [Pelagibacteraceae bacterium TMED216]|nr:MAG: YebC/PmpR family DNA-binding transcriptional regulator [Pelagibacteraceae bacterium TMED216]|tara:strand:- start:97 stop:828 length:732 start_codon:yes stop_codon:yes gene_type:complete
MAGHSHWAGIKHKKDRQDKLRSKLFSKLSREITVAAKLGAKDPDSNPRLRSAIQIARQSNMPKDNISRAIKKSEFDLEQNYENLRYEGYGPFNVALIIETLTDNKNRTASKIRTILQKFGGSLGENGSTSHLFLNYGVIHIKINELSEESILETAIKSGSIDCTFNEKISEIICKKEDFYKVKNEFEKLNVEFIFSGIEWRAKSFINFSDEQHNKIIEMLDKLNEEDDVQNIFLNIKIKELKN